MKIRWLAALAAIVLWCVPARGQTPVIGASCPASGQNGISNTGTPVVCTQPLGGGALVWSAVPAGAGGGSSAAKNSGLAGLNVIYPNAPPYNISYDGQFCIFPSATWSNTSSTLQCFSGIVTGQGSASVTSNVATIAFQSQIPFNPTLQGWAVNDSIVVAGYSGGDTIYNGTFTISALTTNSVSYALVHANASSTSAGNITDRTAPGPFTSADSVKKGFGTNCSSGVLACLTTTAVAPIGTLTFVDSHTVTTSSTTTTACGQSASGCQFWWFTDDRAKWQTVDNAIQTATSCVTVYNPAGVTPIPFGIWNTSSPKCGSTASSVGLIVQTDAGNYLLGQGQGTTIFLIPPDDSFPACTGASGGSTCLGYAFSGGADFTIHGGGFGVVGSHANILFGPNPQANFWRHITMTEFGSGGTGGLEGFAIPFSNQNDAIYVDQFGQDACILNGVNVILTNSFCGDVGRDPIQVSGSGTVARIANTYIGASNSTIGIDVGFLGGTAVTLYCSQCQSYGAVAAGGAHIFVANGSSLYLDQWYNAAGSSYGVAQTAATKVYVHNSSANGSTHCFGTQGVTLTTGSFYNQGGNTCSGAAIEGTLQPTITATGFGTGTVALTGAFNTNEQVNFTITPAGAPATSGTIVDTFNMTYSVNGNTPACTLQLGNGTESWTAPVTILDSAKSTTAYTWAWTAGAAPATTGTLTGVINCTPN